jgi:D-alanyl-D-alanine carboxypeptidase
MRKHAWTYMMVLSLAIGLCGNFTYAFSVNINNLKVLNKELETLLPADAPAASILVTQNGKTLFERYSGLAVLDTKEKLGASHVIGIASMSKPFTALAILKLCEQGELNLDDPICRHMPDLPLGSRTITIRQLLSHTSGLPELTQTPAFMSHISEPHTVGQIIDLAFESEFRSKPGEKFIYCNTGYTIAAALIEKLSGMSYAAYVKKELLVPLGMKNSYICDYKTDATTAIPRYEVKNNSCVAAQKMHFSNLIGGGSIISNVRDMARLANALITGTGLPGNYRAAMQPIMLNSGKPVPYGLGLGITDLNGNKMIYHPGQGDGMDAMMLVFPDQKLTITVIRNISGEKDSSSKNIALRTAELLLTSVEGESGKSEL